MRRYRTFDAWMGFDLIGRPQRSTFSLIERDARIACRAITSKAFPIKCKKVTIRVMDDPAWMKKEAYEILAQGWKR